MPALSEALESISPPQRAHTRDTPSSNPDQSNEYPDRVRSPKRVRFGPVLEVRIKALKHHLSTDSNHQIHTSDDMSASSSEDNPVPGQDPDDPLPNQEDTNAALPGDTAAENYIPWFGLDHELAGLIPAFMAVFWTVLNCFPILPIIWCTLILLLYKYFSEPSMERHLKELILHNYFLMKYLLRILASLSNWVPLAAMYFCLPNRSRLNKWTLGAVILIGPCLFGLLSWAYCALVSSEKSMDSWVGVILQAWSTGTVPQSFRGCAARVEPTQASLFETDIYYTQFARTIYTHSNSTLDYDYEVLYPIFDMERFRSIQVNKTLCNQGIQGNNDLYGLGIRTSLYLQWISSFLANNLLPETRQELQKVYLIFSVAICLAMIITSFAKACVFSIEIEIMYWMYWGGYVCVFASAPCPIRLGSEMKWVKLDWTTTILFTTHALTIYHGVWFIYYAYDQVFARMPCGTYHFFVFLILDPSEGFWTLRDYLAHLLIAFAPPLLAAFPFTGLLLASEVKHTIQHSATYQTLFPKSSISDRDIPQTAEYDTYLETHLGLQTYLFIINRYREFREGMGFPSYSREGVRLVTPIDIRDRRSVAFTKIPTER